MTLDAALYSGSKCYFFDGNQYIRVTRVHGPDKVDPGYPANITQWGWPSGFGSTGIDAALYSGLEMLLLQRQPYIRVTRGDTGPGTVDPGYPEHHPVGMAQRFRLHRIDAALYSGSKCYFFKGNQYIRVTRGDTGPGTVDPGYPANITQWGWPSGFGSTGIDAALYSGSNATSSKATIHSGHPRRYRSRHRRPRYPANITQWGWPRGSPARPGRPSDCMPRS